MAKYTGSLDNFQRFVGPRLRNLVQTSIARRYKLEVGKCQECGKTNELQAAHIHGKDRKTLLKLALGNQPQGEFISDLDLTQFEQRFVALHQPPKDAFLILCAGCHREYDKIVSSIVVDDTAEEDEGPRNNNTLAIELDPPDRLEFKELSLA